MSKKPDLDLLHQMAKRFEDSYFIRSLGDHGVFCIPNFVATIANDTLQIKLLDHVTAEDEAQIRSRLDGLPYAISAERLTLEKIEQQTGQHFPELEDDE